MYMDDTPNKGDDPPNDGGHDDTWTNVSGKKSTQNSYISKKYVYSSTFMWSWNCNAKIWIHILRFH